MLEDPSQRSLSVRVFNLRLLKRTANVKRLPIDKYQQVWAKTES